MKETLHILWNSAPEVVSILGIIGLLSYIVVKITVFYTRIETRLDTMEKDISEMRKDINKILEYLVTGKVETLLKK